jgi:hypothetical protein
MGALLQGYHRRLIEHERPEWNHTTTNSTMHLTSAGGSGQASEAEQQVIIASREGFITSLQEGDNLFVDEKTLARMRESMYMQERGENPFEEEDEDAADEDDQ